MADNQAQEPSFTLEKIYLKDVSYEAPHVPQVFLEKSAPDVGVQLGIEHQPLPLGENAYEVVLTVTVTAKLGEKAVFLAEAKQAGIFRVIGLDGERLAQVLEITCPTILLPFVREALNDLVSKGGFPQLLINPINFEALYQQKHGQGEETH